MKVLNGPFFRSLWAIMKKILGLLTALSFVGSAFAAPNFVQDPNTGDSAWGPIGTFSFEDDLIIDDQSYDISSITTYELWGDGEIYTLNLWSDYTDQGGVLLNSWTVDNSGGFFNGDGQFEVAYDTTGLSLAPGTYVLQFQASSAAFGGDYNWFNANLDAVVGNEAYIPGFGFSTDFAGQSFDMSWAIDATPSSVPEPASLAVLGLGAFALIRRRKISK